MAIWVFQILFDIALVALAVSWLLNRRLGRTDRARVSEEKIEALSAEPVASIPVEPTVGPALGAEALAKTSSTLSERTVNAARVAFSKVEKPSFDAYETADQLIAKGVDLREVARRTGLSLSELQLLGKISQRNQ